MCLDWRRQCDEKTGIERNACGSIEDFAKKCNERAYELGLRNTNFKNPHGLYDKEHYTSAYDLALLTAEALKDPLIRKIFYPNFINVKIVILQFPWGKRRHVVNL